MHTTPLSDAKDHLSEYVDRVATEHERVTITRNGRPAAVLISPEDLDSLEETLAILSDPAELAALREGLDDLDAGRSTTLEALKAELR